MEQPESENLKIRYFLKMAASTWQAYNFVQSTTLRRDQADKRDHFEKNEFPENPLYQPYGISFIY